MKFIFTCLLLCWFTLVAFAQKTSIPALHTSSDSLVMYLDGQKDEFNGVNKLGSTFDYSFVVAQDSSVFKLVSTTDSIQVVLLPGKNTVFQIVRMQKRDTVTCAFTIQKRVKPVAFNEKYKAANSGKTRIEIPEVYELVNVIFALTEYGKTNAIYKNTDYYKAVISRFAPYGREEAVQVVDSLLKLSPSFFYLHLKMDSYAYIFQGRSIVNGGIYDRIATGDKNELEPYLPLLEAFAVKSEFRDFYSKHTSYYENLIADYKRSINIADMKSWLSKQFPATHYDAVKVIFSPLVGWNQSANFFNDNGFTEAQAHVNFPFVEKNEQPDVIRGTRMLIAFTEINHAYLNPEAEKHQPAVSNAFGDLSKWTTAGKPAAGYDTPLVCFEEYMNYGLVTLYYADIFDQKTSNALNERTEHTMEVSRGFKKFKAFNQELLRLYKSRTPGQTVADLYPAMLAWASRSAAN